MPEDVARKIEAGFTNVTLARPGDPDVFITAAEDLARYRTQSAVESRLALPSGPQRAVITFKQEELHPLSCELDFGLTGGIERVRLQRS
ncbi:MAG: hypothetical protein J7575_10635, partial [Chloroflexi bacterium]|nr:hypothetical protein [Chloroflexota bacterium]